MYKQRRGTQALSAHALKHYVTIDLMAFCTNSGASLTESTTFRNFLRAVLGECTTVEDVVSVIPPQALKHVKVLVTSDSLENRTISTKEIAQMRERYHEGFQLLNQYLLLHMIED